MDRSDSVQGIENRLGAHIPGVKNAINAGKQLGEPRVHIAVRV